MIYYILRLKKIVHILIRRRYVLDIILASKSPRRIELLKMSGIDFSVESSNINEDEIKNQILRINKDKNIEEISKILVERLAYEKAKYIFEKKSKKEDKLVIGSDTIVTNKEKILGKPKDEGDARRMLESLCGKTHCVYTGVSLITRDSISTFYSVTEVSFQDLDEFTKKIIDDYIKTTSPMDKAGAYGIQDMGALLVKKIHGDYYSVMGLPISELTRRIHKMINNPQP